MVTGCSCAPVVKAAHSAALAHQVRYEVAEVLRVVPRIQAVYEKHPGRRTLRRGGCGSGVGLCVAERRWAGSDTLRLPQAGWVRLSAQAVLKCGRGRLWHPLTGAG